MILSTHGVAGNLAKLKVGSIILECRLVLELVPSGTGLPLWSRQTWKNAAWPDRLLMLSPYSKYRMIDLYLEICRLFFSHRMWSGKSQSKGPADVRNHLFDLANLRLGIESQKEQTEGEAENQDAFHKKR